MSTPAEPKDIFFDIANAPPISELAGIEDPSTYWPLSLAHLRRSHNSTGSDYVIVGEISEAPEAGFVGFKTVSVALVPHALVEQVINSTAATGHEVRSHGPLPIVDDDDNPHRSGFWVDGIERET